MLEEGDEKLLIDPGGVLYLDPIDPKDIPIPNGILLTHEHPDHYAPDVIQQILHEQAIPIITNVQLAEKTKKDGLHAEIIQPGETKVLGAFTIIGVAAAHGHTTKTSPDNIGFIVNGTVYHPGDSFLGEIPYGEIQVLALPIVSPWGPRFEAFAYAKKVHPKIVIPIHDAYFKDFFIKGQNIIAAENLGEAGITVKPLGPGESLEV